MTIETRERLAELARLGDTARLIEALGSASAEVIDRKGDSLLMLATYYGHKDTVWALLKRGADPSARSARGLSPVDGAAFKGDIDVLTALLDGGADPDAAAADGRTPLMWAAGFDRADAAQLLLSRGADPAARDYHGRNAYEHAIVLGATRTAGLLAMFGAVDVGDANRRVA